MDMVTNVTSLTGNGLKDWLIQRATALYLIFYTGFLLGYCLFHPGLDYSQWYALFHDPKVQIASVIALVFLSLHAWIGIWTVTTDYLACTCLRLPVQGLVVVVLLAQVVWGFMIIWGR